MSTIINKTVTIRDSGEAIVKITPEDIIVNGRSFNALAEELEAIKIFLIKTNLVKQEELDQIRESIKIMEKLT